MPRLATSAAVTYPAAATLAGVTVPPANAAQAKSLLAMATTYAWRHDRLNTGDLASKAVTATLTAHGSLTYQQIVSGRLGGYSGAANAAWSADVCSVGTNCFALAVRTALVSAVGGATYHGVMGRASTLNKGWLLYQTTTGNLLYYLNDSTHQFGADGDPIATGLLTAGAEPLDVVMTVDTTQTPPVAFFRVCRNGLYLGSKRVTLTSLGSLDASGQEFGFGPLPAASPGLSNGAGCWWEWAALGIGSDAAGETKALGISQRAGFEPSYGTNPVIMCVGDSITVGAGSSDGISGYRPTLAALRPELIFVGTQGSQSVGFHEGQSGYTISNMRATQLPRAAMQAPTVVLIIAGTNDISAGTATSTILANLVQLAEDFKALPSVQHVIVGTVPPRLASDGNYAPTVALNAGITGSAFATASSGITTYDVSGSIVAATDLYDSVHPNDLGYPKLGLGCSNAIGSLGL